MLDSSANQIWTFGGGGVKRTHAGTGDFEYAGPRPKNDCSRDEGASPASYVLTYNCKGF